MSSFLLSTQPCCPKQLYSKEHSGWYLSTWITVLLTLWIHHLTRPYLFPISLHVSLLKFKEKKKTIKKNLRVIYKINMPYGDINMCLHVINSITNLWEFLKICFWLIISTSKNTYKLFDSKIFNYTIMGYWVKDWPYGEFLTPVINFHLWIIYPSRTMTLKYFYPVRFFHPSFLYSTFKIFFLLHLRESLYCLSAN